MSYKEDTLFSYIMQGVATCFFPCFPLILKTRLQHSFCASNTLRKQNAIIPDKQRKGKPLCRSEAVLRRKAISRKYRYFIDINEHKTVTTTLSVFSFISHFFWSSRLCLTKMNISLRR